ncbi:isopeptide-forming domain-containing fimbrial protein, partial [Enterococcus faecalis]|uniref:isopeptide-forming domain-containing fimbrial protein n=4 Tax=Enterococcus faecalis TaxID=1351 RepID=UPI001F065C1E
SLKGGEGVTVSFKVKVTEKATGTVTNVATVDGNVPPETPGEPDKPTTPETPEVPVGVPGEVTGEKLVNGQSSSTSYVGDVVTYTIRLNHTKGTGEWTGSITDKLPENMSYQAGTTTFNGTAVKDADVWKEGTLTVPNVTVNDANETAEVTFKAKINKEALGTTVKNKAEATPNTPTDPNDPNNPNTPDIPEVPSKVVPSAGKLATEKTVYDKDGNSVGNQKVKVGDIIEYRINAKNTEGAETIVNNVKVSDEIPAGLSYQVGSLKVTMPDGSTNQLSDEQVNGQSLATGDLGSLKGGEGVTVSFKVKVTEKATGTIKNIAKVDGNVPPETPGEPDKPTTPETPEVPVGVPGEVTGEKLVNGQSSSTSYVGDVVTYTIRLNHTKGTGEWTGSITDKLPENMSYQVGTTTFNGTAVKDADVWKEGTLAVPNVTVNDANETAEVTFKAKINKEAVGTTVKNKAEATPNTPTDPNDPNNPNTPDIPEVPSKVVPSAGKLATEKTVYDKDGNSVENQKVKVGDIIEYRINAKNTEGAETIVNNVKVSDEIPAGLSYQAGSLKVTMPDGSTKTLSDEQVNGQSLATGDLGSLKGGEGVTVSFKVKVTEKATGTIKNIAKVDGNVPPETPGEPDKPITPETPEVPVGVPGEVTGEKLVNGQSSSTSYVGDVVTYTIRLNHTKGTGEWTGSITDKLPENMSYQVGTTTFNGTAVKDADVWKEGTLAVPNVTVNDANETAEVTFKAKINKEAVGTTVKNKAEATPNTPTDPNDPNNPNTPDIPEVPSKVVPSAGKLATEKTVYDKDGNSVENKKVKVGDIIEYRINAKNTEGAETIVNNVKVSDEIPAGLSYQAGSLKVTMPDGSTKTLSDEQVNGQSLATGDLGSLKGGEGVTVSFKVKVTEKATGTVTNVATVDGNVPPKTPGEPDIPLTPEKPRVVTNVSKKKETNTPLNVPPRSRENLPSTGEKLSYILPVSGVIVVLFVAGYKLKRRK